MTRFIIHIGAPRTGTTVLQKHIFPKLRNTLALSKRPFQASFGNPGTITRTYSSKRLEEFSADEKADLLENSIMAGTMSHDDKEKARTVSLLQELNRQGEIAQVLISSELLCDTTASLNGNSRHTSGTSQAFWIYSLLDLFQQANTKAEIAVCLREPLKYLTSKYLRTIVQRENAGLRFLRPSEFIAKQIILEQESPGSSVITQACHKSFIEQLSAKSSVKHFGFKQLLQSTDVFQLFGLTGEKKLSFTDFPPENSLRFDASCREQAMQEIQSTLRNLGYQKLIEESRIHE